MSVLKLFLILDSFDNRRLGEAYAHSDSHAIRVFHANYGYRINVKAVLS